MFPLKDENPHPPGFKPKLTIALIIINVVVFGIEVSVTGEFFDFTNRQAMNMFLNWVKKYEGQKCFNPME